MLSVYVLLAVSYNFLKFPSLSFSCLLLLYIGNILLLDKFPEVCNSQSKTEMEREANIIQNSGLEARCITRHYFQLSPFLKEERTKLC